MKNLYLVMKVFILIRLLILSGPNSQAQTNLVSNPSFEYTTWDNTYITTLNFVGWITPPNSGSSPDGFKNYAIGNCSPGEYWGNQHTISRDTYACANEKFIGNSSCFIQGRQQNEREYTHLELRVN